MIYGEESICNGDCSLAVALAAVAVASFSLSQPAGTKSFELDAREFGFSQVEGGPTLRVKAGDTVTITLVNIGAEEHEWMVVSKDTLAVALNPSVGEEGEEELERVLGGHPEPVFEGAMIHHLEPGETKTITFVADTAAS